MIFKETTDAIRKRYGNALNHIRIERVVLGLFFGGIKLSNGCGGISYMPTADIHNDEGREMMSLAKLGPGTLGGVSVSSMLGIKDPSVLIRTVQLLILNALSQPFLNKDKYNVFYNEDVLAYIDFRSVKRVAMIGAIYPFIKVFKKHKEIVLHVIDQKKQSLKGSDKDYYVSPTLSGQTIALSDTVIITGAAVANGTIDNLLACTTPWTKVILAGPTVSFIPDALFERGVDVVSGTIVSDIDKTLSLLAEGAGAYHLFHNSCLQKINIINDGRKNGVQS